MIARLLAILLVMAPSAANAVPARPETVSDLGAPWSPDLGDPVLADLLVRAELGSLDLKMALARLERASADVDLTRAGRRPHLTIGAEVAAGGGDFSSVRSGAGIPVQGGYEVDMFGRLKHGQQAAVADEAASLQDAAGVRRQVLAAVAHAYIALRAAQAHQAAAEVLTPLAVQVSDLIRRRQADGAATGAEVGAAWAQENETRAELQRATHAVEAERARLGILLGLDAPIDEPAYAGDEIPPTPAVTTVSSEAVLARADILGAQARLRAADARRAEAVATSRPRFILTAGIGSGDADLLYLLDVRALAWAVAGGITHELLDGGAAKARQRGAVADATLAELAYRKAVGGAWGQARLALATLQDATTTETLARERWRRDVVAFGTGLTRHRDGDIDGVALAALEVRAAGADTALADAQAARAQAYIDLSLALGGGVP
ncbi:efflux transporter outer membrane subunit [soil metagenome]